MIDNVGRKVALIVTVLLVAIFAIFYPGLRPRLGLDLRGGTRVVLRIPFADAVAQKQITEEEVSNKQLLIEQMIQIYRERIDPSGVKDPLITAQGEDRIVIELPSLEATVARQATGKLAKAITPEDGVLELAAESEDALKDFPAAGGTIEIEREVILYEQRTGKELVGLTRGAVDKAMAHAQDALVVLKETDELQKLVTSTGDLHFYIEALPADFSAAGTDQATELAKVQTWMKSNPQAATLEAYNALPRDLGGPPTKPRVLWFTMAADSKLETPFVDRRPVPVVEDENEAWRFSGADLASEGIGPTADDTGLPAVGFKIVDAKAEHFGDFTEEHKDLAMAVVINGEIATMPKIKSRLAGGGRIEGGGLAGFSEEEVKGLVTVLRSGSLRIRPVIESKERVGATLGASSIRRGSWATLASLVLVMGFMIAYYRKLGVIASISLVANLVLLMGVMAFWQATLTLPGIGGMILTIGMSVDSNILIYERMREEQLRGRKPLQAAKDGFAHANATIIDANLTTLVSGIVLYVLGSGPVRGFATTLCVGILTTMFAALVITRVLVHFALVRGVDSWNMARWITEPNVKFMSKAKPAIAASLIVIVAGLIAFAVTPDRQKLGIEFMGGVTMTVRTEKPHSVQEVRERVASIPGTIGETSEVKALLASGSEGEGYNQFRITFKSEENSKVSAEITDALKDVVAGDIRNALSDFLERGPYELTVAAGVPKSTVDGRLYFDAPHPTEDVSAALAEIPIEAVQVEKLPGTLAGYSFQGQVTPDRTEVALREGLEKQFAAPRKDSQQQAYGWAEPIADITSVGAAVVSEMRDKAIVALIVSMFAIVMYIRVRFAEYSYGIAAVVALIHDVLVTFAVMSFVVLIESRTGITLVDAEITLATIAAFLTLIGYSVNDTVVTFDRVRENIPRMNASLYDILDLSVNQTLGRTILTAGTVFLTVVILLAFNIGSRNVLEGFAFAMLIGTIAGTYSTVFIASPVLLWLENRREAKEKRENEGTASAGLRPHPKAS